MKRILLLLLSIFIVGCSSLPKEKEKVELVFLDEYIYPINKSFNGTKIGGLSGIDKLNNDYFLVADDSKKPRYYKVTILIKNKKIDSVIFNKVINLTNDTYYKNNFLDLESIVAEPERITLVSEGSINKNKDPLLFSTSENGTFITDFKLPAKFLSSTHPKPIHNKTLEGLSHSVNRKGYWTAFELPLIQDGDEPKYNEANSPIRITYFDKKSREPTKEYAYQLDPITKPNVGNFNLNGVTDILEYKPNHFFVIERTYQSDKGAYGNTVNIFYAYPDKNTTNTLEIDSLKKTKYIPLKKELLFEFDSVKNKLTEGIIDNIEGICFGPILENGNQSLILISDDNFQAYGKQLNQFLLLEIKNNNLQ